MQWVTWMLAGIHRRVLEGQAALWCMCAISSPASTGSQTDLAEQIKARLQGEGLLSEIDAFDLLRGGDSHDLSSIALREQIIEDIENKYGIVVSSPPCNTYSRLNWSENPGPRPIRCRTHPRGFPWLRQRFRWKRCNPKRSTSHSMARRIYSGLITPRLVHRGPPPVQVWRSSV